MTRRARASPEASIRLARSSASLSPRSRRRAVRWSKRRPRAGRRTLTSSHRPKKLAAASRHCSKRWKLPRQLVFDQLADRVVLERMHELGDPWRLLVAFANRNEVVVGVV